MQLDRGSAASISTLSIQIRLIDAVMGAEVTGADLSQPLDEATLETFKDALHRYKVLAFRDQHLGVAGGHPVAGRYASRSWRRTNGGRVQE